uniref:Uncharacterized protein n=1 Tax=Macaca fascicularis TaxID=9541 RepID=Q2PFR0_MACFA|nr:hypothetical protein [Macaca fascicularis]
MVSCQQHLCCWMGTVFNPGLVCFFQYVTSVLLLTSSMGLLLGGKDFYSWAFRAS